MSIARQRRETAAALALLIRGKLMSLEAATERQDDEAAQDAALELALVQQNNAALIIWVLENYAGGLNTLNGKNPSSFSSLAEATHSDIKSGL